jgi:hypothetical protein
VTGEGGSKKTRKGVGNHKFFCSRFGAKFENVKKFSPLLDENVFFAGVPFFPVLFRFRGRGFRSLPAHVPIPAALDEGSW